ncbi:hypothetical protein [Dyella acidiphila]|uniref:Uncharacterized protein n=1 Tax=Dyella acidiphila TaxID=2775866 RepID=A0ABR9G4S6_9GAMM|nr:hypothetical protein [Dyella acidiphila]MBE1159056.1 hypothetical protein [Dyella acidiphila]
MLPRIQLRASDLPKGTLCAERQSYSGLIEGDSIVQMMDMDPSRREAWRESLPRSVAIALGLLLHLGLLLLVLRPPIPWLWRRSVSMTEGRPLQIELLAQRRSVAKRAVPAMTAPPHPVHVRAASMRSAEAIPSAVAAPSTPSPAPSLPGLTQPPSPPAGSYGNTRFARALDAAQSSGLPQLPGTYAVSNAPGIVVTPPPSLQARLQKAVRWLNCKNAIFKRRMTDQELIKRGLTHQQMDRAYQDYCVP